MRQLDENAWPRGKSNRELKALGGDNAERARQRPDVIAARERYVPNGLLDWADVPDWIRSESAADKPAEYRTFDHNDRLVRAERPVVEYVGPDDSSVRSVRSTPALEDLRCLSLGLERAYGWRPAAAVAFVLANVVPVTGPRLVESTATGAQPKISVTGIDPSDDPEAVAAIIRREREQLGEQFGLRKPSDTDRERFAKLSAYAAKHGTGVNPLTCWNRKYLERRGWTYSRRDSFYRAANRAEAALGRPKGPRSSR